MAKQKYYAVWKGRKTGVFNSWDDCRVQVDGFDGAQYKSFENLAEAKHALTQNPFKVFQKSASSSTALTKANNTTVGNYEKNAIVVDGACAGNPGQTEYQGVYLQTREKIFHQGPFAEGTNNIAEFLALVHALGFCKKRNLNIPIYSDSETALAWVRKKKAGTKLQQTAKNQVLFDMLDRAENWLQSNSYTNPIRKWETSIWGENPADFGRK